MEDKVLLVGLVIAFFCIPFLPWQVLMLSDLVLVRIILLVCFLAGVNKNPVVGILTLLVIGMLFIERNKVKVNYLRRTMQQSDSESPAIQSIVTPETAPEQPDFETPREDSVPFFPQNDAGDNHFYPVSSTINEKQPLQTESSNGAKFAIRQLYNWVNPELAQESRVK
jgi:hypothetical protein